MGSNFGRLTLKPLQTSFIGTSWSDLIRCFNTIVNAIRYACRMLLKNNIRIWSPKPHRIQREWWRVTCNREHLRHVTFIVLLSTHSRTNINCCRKSTRASGKQRIFYVISIDFGFCTIELGISSPPHPAENHLSNLAICFHLLIRPFVPFVFVGATTKLKMNANKFRENEIGERSHCAVFLFF